MNIRLRVDLFGHLASRLSNEVVCDNGIPNYCDKDKVCEYRLEASFVVSSVRYRFGKTMGAEFDGSSYIYMSPAIVTLLGLRLGNLLLFPLSSSSS